MIPNVGPAEIIVVLIVALLVLGPKKLPAVGRSLGGSLREFKNGITGHEAEPEQVEAGTGTKA
jgi:sec-independent protein translocase protein TatA